MAIFAGVACIASICSINTLVYCAFTVLFRASLGDPAVIVWYLALAMKKTALPKALRKA